MRIVTFDKSQLKKYCVDKEMLQKASRPCVLIIQLKYKSKRYDFAVPLRSNISPSTPKPQYFSLPPRHTTKDGYRHGIHYIKMFPIDKKTAQKFHVDSPFYSTIKSIIEANQKEIISSCQNYLVNYANGHRPKFSTDIDLLIKVLENEEL